MLKIIDEVEYDNGFNQIIVHDEKHGYVYAQTGMSSIYGYHTWRDGVAAFVKEGDTIESLSSCKWNTYTNHLDAILHGADAERPLCTWMFSTIENHIIAAYGNS